jgi:hypothetical protein
MKINDYLIAIPLKKGTQVKVFIIVLWGNHHKSRFLFLDSYVTLILFGFHSAIFNFTEELSCLGFKII